VALIESPTGAVSHGKPAIRNLNSRIRLTAQLTYGLYYFGHATAMRGMIATKAAAVGINGQLANPRN
jgi:hypothetical protein